MDTETKDKKVPQIVIDNENDKKSDSSNEEEEEHGYLSDEEHSQMEKQMTASPEDTKHVSKLVKSLSLGTDLTKSSLPISFFLPKSFIEIFAEQSSRLLYLLKKANELEDPLLRMINVVWYFLSSLGEYPGAKKPFNPILGETYIGKINDKDGNVVANVLAEQVEHHPPTTSLYISNNSFKVNMYMTQNASFWGKHLKVKNGGSGIIYLPKPKEEYCITEYPSLYFRFLQWKSEWNGSLKIQCEKTNLNCVLQFKDKKFFGGQWDRVEGEIFEKAKSTKTCLATIKGIWSQTVSAFEGKTDKVLSTYQLSQFPLFSVVADDTDPKSSSQIWKSTITALKEGDQTRASTEKLKVEDEQRERKKTGTSFQPRYFSKTKSNTWQPINP